MTEVFTKVLPKCIVHTMTYSTILTSKGTTTIPKEIRDELGMLPGSIVSFTKDSSTGQYSILRPKTIEDIRKVNQAAMLREGTIGYEYKSGDGFNAHVAKKYGVSK
jgi:AbrB family looped-hinge helix DNA binding protein